MYFYYNFHLAEKYRYTIKKQNQYVSNMPEDTLGIIHLTDYYTGGPVKTPMFTSAIFFDVCDKMLFLNYEVIYHHRGNEIWSR